MTDDDMTLVREFAARNSEAAFTSLVERQAGDAHLAEEITQAVFIHDDLATRYPGRTVAKTPVKTP